MAKEPDRHELSAEDADQADRPGQPSGSRKPRDRAISAERPAGGSRPDRPALTERQRAEARRRRQARRQREKRSQPGNALSRGVRATGHEIAATARFVARAVAAALEATGPIGRSLRSLATGIVAGVVAVAGFLRFLAATVTRVFGRTLALLDRTLTPRRAILLAAGLAALLLAVSQFMDFRATEIGQPGYSGIEGVTSAPRVDVHTPAQVHWLLLLAAAAAGLAGLAGFIRAGKRRFALFPAFAGFITVAVTLAIDLPAGLDTADAGLSYSGVSAVLLSGFWLQLATGTVLAVTGMLLWLEGPLPGGSVLTTARGRPA